MPAPLDPEGIFAALATHGVAYVLIGGLAGVVHGSPAMTNDADIVPAKTDDNLERLSAALLDLDARLRSPDEPDGLAFEPHPTLLSSMSMLNMTTRCGDLDMTFTPAGLDGYDGLAERSVVYELGGHRVQVAALSDIIRSKEAADRPKDHATLPVLRALQDEIDG